MGAVTKLETIRKESLKDGDGDDGDLVPTETITIRSVENGWLITTAFEDGTEVVEVFDTEGADNGDLQAVRCVIESMGVEDSISIK